MNSDSPLNLCCHSWQDESFPYEASVYTGTCLLTKTKLFSWENKWSNTPIQSCRSKLFDGYTSLTLSDTKKWVFLQMWNFIVIFLNKIQLLRKIACSRLIHWSLDYALIAFIQPKTSFMSLLRSSYDPFLIKIGLLW